jgi:hypothetical protein
MKWISNRIPAWSGSPLAVFNRDGYPDFAHPLEPMEWQWGRPAQNRMAQRKGAAMKTSAKYAGTKRDQGFSARQRYPAGRHVAGIKTQTSGGIALGRTGRSATGARRRGIWLYGLMILAAGWLAPLDAAAWQSINKKGGAGKTAEVKAEKVTVLGMNNNKNIVAAGDWVRMECTWSVSPSKGYSTYVGGGSWTNELRVDGKVVRSCPASLEYNSVLYVPIVQTCGPTHWIAKGVGEHSATCLVNANNKLPEKAAHKGNNSVSTSFTVVKVLKQPTSWPSYSTPRKGDGGEMNQRQTNANGGAMPAGDGRMEGSRQGAGAERPPQAIGTAAPSPSHRQSP